MLPTLFAGPSGRAIQMPSIEIVCVGQQVPIAFDALPFAVSVYDLGEADRLRLRSSTGPRMISSF